MAAIFNLYLTVEDWTALHAELTRARPNGPFDGRYSFDERKYLSKPLDDNFTKDMRNDKSLTFKAYITNLATLPGWKTYWNHVIDREHEGPIDIDATFPRCATGQQFLARRLFEAIVNLDDIVDKPKKAVVDSVKKRKGNGGDAIPQVDDNEEKIENNTQVAGILSRSNIEIEMLAWELIVQLFPSSRLCKY